MAFKQKTSLEYSAINPFFKNGKWYLEYTNFDDTFEIYNSEEEALKYKRINLANLISREESLAKIAKEEAEAMAKDNAIINSYNGFLSENPKTRGLQRKTLETQFCFNGIVKTRKQDLEDRINNGYFVQNDKIINNEGWFREINKTEKSYAEFYINLKDKKD